MATPDMTPAQLVLVAAEVAKLTPDARLVKNGVGNLAIMRGEVMIGYLDLRYGEVCWIEDEP